MLGLLHQTIRSFIVAFTGIFPMVTNGQSLIVDPSFDAGYVVAGRTRDWGNRIAMDSMGKYLFVPESTNYTIERLNSDGTADNSFISGTFDASGLGGFRDLYAIAVTPENKIIVTGNFTTYNGITRNGIVKLNSDGSIDETFNPGQGLLNTFLNSIESVHKIIPLANGKLLICGGFNFYGGKSKRCLVRLNADGTLDNSFNTVGTGISGNGYINSMAMQNDGKIVIGGDFVGYNGVTRAKIARINTDGSIDNSFNPGSGANNTVLDVGIQSDGKIIIAGFFTSYNGSQANRITRLQSNGLKDLTFNSAGPNFVVRSLAILKDTKILIGGAFTTVDGIDRNGLARLNSNGSLDNTLTVGSGAEVQQLILQPDEKVIIGGNFFSFDDIPRYHMARLTYSTNCKPSVTISTASQIICFGNEVSFNATHTNGGTNPQYLWRKNGVEVGTNSDTYRTNSLANGDVITCSLTSSLPCAGTTPVISNSIEITIDQKDCVAIDKVKITPSDTTVCADEFLTLSVDALNGEDKCGTYSLTPSLKQGLLAWYPFCGNTNDYSGQSNHGIATGALIYSSDRYGHEKTAIQFSGQGEAIKTNKIDRTTTNSFTYVAWIKTDNVVALPAETIDRMSGFSTDLGTSCVIHATHGFNWNLNNQHTGAGLYVSKNGVFFLEHADLIVATPLSWSGNLEGWHSVALVYDNHIPKLYIDGNFIKNGLATPYSVHPSLGCDSFYMNNNYPYLRSGFGKGFNPGVGVPFNNFKGQIDDIKVYNRTLSEAELKQLYAKDKLSFLWSTGDTTTSIRVKALKDTLYSVIVTNNQGRYYDTVHVKIKPRMMPKVSISSTLDLSTPICKGLPITFTSAINNVSGQLKYQWLKNNQPVGLNSLNYTDNNFRNGDMIKCVVSATGNCIDPTPVESNTITLKINETLGPKIDLGKDVSICADSFQINASPGYKTYQWQDGSTNPVLNVKKSGTYTILVTDACDNPFKDTILIELNQVPNFTIGSNKTICEGDSVTLTASEGFINHKWTPSSNSFSTGPGVLTVFPNSTTIYTASAQTLLGCDAKASITISVLPKRIINLGADTSICKGDSLLLQSGNGFMSYQWNDGQTVPQVTVKGVGSYSVRAVDQNGCTATDTIRIITAFELPSVSLNKEDWICEKSTKLLDAGSGFSSYLWSNGNTSQRITVNSPGNYSVTVMDRNGCKATDIVEISRVQPIPSDFLISDTAICQYGKVILTPTKTYASYFWSTGSIMPKIEISKKGTYTLQVTDSMNCVATSTVTVHEKACLEGLFVPNAFTPNSDGKNDVLRPKLLGDVKQYKFTIFSRWGDKVFESTKPEEGWNGKLKETQKETGVFVWICQYQLAGKELKVEKGTFVLIR